MNDKKDEFFWREIKKSGSFQIVAKSNRNKTYAMTIFTFV